MQDPAVSAVPRPLDQNNVYESFRLRVRPPPEFRSQYLNSAESKLNIGPQRLHQQFRLSALVVGVGHCCSMTMEGPGESCRRLSCEISTHEIAEPWPC